MIANPIIVKPTIEMKIMIMTMIKEMSFEDLQPNSCFLRCGKENKRKTHSQLFTITSSKE